MIENDDIEEWCWTGQAIIALSNLINSSYFNLTLSKKACNLGSSKRKCLIEFLSGLILYGPLQSPCFNCMTTEKVACLQAKH